MADVVIVGAGPVGANAALFLAALGISVDLVEAETDILRGASRAAFIHHGDGFEYYKPGHRRTGEYCIDGAFVKSLLYPIDALRTTVCDAEHPIRFLLTRASAHNDGITFDEFLENARSMQRHFTRRFASLSQKLGSSAERTEALLSRSPATFFRPLATSEFADVAGVVGGCAGSSFGINMARYYAFVRQGLRARRVEVHRACAIEAIEKRPEGFAVFAGGRKFLGRHVLLAAGHQVPRLVAKVRGVDVASPTAGTYFLNAMTFLELPATRDHETRTAARRINFALQQEHGGMFACVAAPSAHAAGMAVVYAPSSSGSQLRSHPFDGDAPHAPPEDWERSIQEGLPAGHTNVLGMWRRIRRLYPFLDGYAKVTRTICRTVFNVGTADSNGGNDRRVREIVDVDRRITPDGGISAWAAPKWTNAELVALMAADYVLKRLGAPPLPRHEEFGFGPASLDVAELADSLRLTEMREADARHYADVECLPASLAEVAHGRAAQPK